ncbi:hypothetical protein HS088_TW07G01139 [Tripterygium wilfordii]|uniref:Uncharacterized protein n=1 Tax=Tripterygium wilfordii TaxID=458696 RepID=A0A7J7DGR6_TRIWF|nr:hypothetical protein HS088_TW07G01139 [Tripterygium wilfordii]
MAMDSTPPTSSYAAKQDSLRVAMPPKPLNLSGSCQARAVFGSCVKLGGFRGCTHLLRRDRLRMEKSDAVITSLAVLKPAGALVRILGFGFDFFMREIHKISSEGEGDGMGGAAIYIATFI